MKSPGLQFFSVKFGRALMLLTLTSLIVGSQLGRADSWSTTSVQSSLSPGQLFISSTVPSPSQSSASAATAASSTSGTCAQAWEQFHGDASHSGFSCYNGPLNNNTLWTFQLPSGLASDNGLISSNHMLIISSVMGGGGGGMRPIFEQNGSAVSLPSGGCSGGGGWCYNQQYCCAASVYGAIGGGLLYFAEYGGVNSLFIQADYLTTGLVASSLAYISNPPCNSPPPDCDPFFGDGFVTYYNGELLDVSYGSPKIEARQATTIQNVLWPQESLKGIIDTIPTGASNGEVAVGYSNANYLTAINATVGPSASGKALWNFTTSAPIIATPAFASGSFYVGTAGGTVYSVSTTGSQNWSVNLNSGVIDATPAVAYGTVFVATDDSHIYALDATNGAKLWTFTGNGPFLASPAVSNNKILYDGTSEGLVYAVNVTNGHLIWSYDTGAPITSSPVLDSINSLGQGALFVVNQRGKIFAFPDPTPVAARALVPLPQWSQFQGNAAHDGNSSFIGPSAPTLIWGSITGALNGALTADNHQLVVTSAQSNQLFALNERSGKNLLSYYLSNALGTRYPASQGALLFFWTIAAVVAE